MKKRQKIVYSKEGYKFVVAEEPPTTFKDSTWYCWVGPKERPTFWSEEGGQDFLLDGKAHLSILGDANKASFADSPEPGRMWYWRYDIKYFRECSLSLTGKRQTVVFSKDGQVFRVGSKPPKKFRANRWYCWLGPKRRQPGWNLSGDMNFVLDSKAHLCCKAEDHYAAFVDSPDPDRLWNWGESIEHFRQCK
ncbi:MAG TPA: hypothetical protein PKZ16_02970 [bacterium]|nr:hypothetical protein [bacterium]HPL95167.1 hypothetical protein [bacterium]